MAASGLPTYAEMEKSLPPPVEGKGRVVVFRPGSGMTIFKAELNGARADLVGGVFVYEDLAPGEYGLAVKGTALLAGSRSATVRVAAGRAVYVEVPSDPIVGAVGEPRFHESPPEALAGCRHNFKDAQQWSRHDERGRLIPAG
jgi:hypothetical protein